jgi:hypothetical protein
MNSQSMTQEALCVFNHESPEGTFRVSGEGEIRSYIFESVWFLFSFSY